LPAPKRITFNNFLPFSNWEKGLKDWKMGLQETKKLVPSKRNGHQIEDTVHRIGENLWQLYI
jgi:hypothetical protein